MLGSLWLLASGLTYFVGHPLRALRPLWEIVVKIVAYVSYPWRRLFWFLLYCYLTAYNRIFLLVIKFISTPVWFLTALQREKLLDTQIHAIEKHLVECIQKNRELEHKLDVSQKDRKHIKKLLEEAEDENTECIEKIKLLEIRVQELEAQNLALKMKQEERILKTVHESRIRENSQNGKVQQQGAMTRPSLKKVPAQKVDQSFVVNKRDLYGWKSAALGSSVFSACLALLVGMIVWEAQDPCLPLVIALFIVVCISLKNVVQFFLILDNRPGFDAIALLCFNWFVMGTLAFPALPNVAELIEPAITKVGDWLIKLIGWYPHG